MNHLTTPPTTPRPIANAAAWWKGIARGLLRLWAAACSRAEAKDRFVPYY